MQVLLKRKFISSKTMIILLTVSLILHVFIESMRWQMTPVYFTILIALFGEYFNKVIDSPWLRGAVFGLGLIGVICSAVLAYLLPIFKLPKPTGPFDVRTTYCKFQTKDDSLGAKIWFPAFEKPKRKVRAKYHPKPANALKGVMGMPGFIFSHFKIVKTSAYSTIDLSVSDTLQYPIVFYSHGAMSNYIDNTALLQEITSRGYVVVALDHQFSLEKYGIDPALARSLDPVSQMLFIDQLLQYAVPDQVNDFEFVKEQIAKGEPPWISLIDTSRIAYIGHSLGGATAVEAMSQNADLGVGVNLDGPINPNCVDSWNDTLLYISAFSPDLPDNELAKREVPPDFYRAVKNYELTPVKALFSNESVEGSWLRIKQAGHLDFTDVPYLMPMLKSKRYHRSTGHQLKAKIIVNFLDTYLKKLPAKEINHGGLEQLF